MKPDDAFTYRIVAAAAEHAAALPAVELAEPAGLREQLAHEAANGLDPAKRVAMRLALRPA